AASPLLTSALHGPVVVVEPLTPGLPQLGVDLRGQLALKLRGDFVVGTTAGNVFEGLPDIPISRFELDFAPGGLLSTSRDLCTAPAPTFHAIFDAHSGAHQEGDVPATVDGCVPTASVRLTRATSRH